MLKVDLARLEREGPLQVEGSIGEEAFFEEDGSPYRLAGPVEVRFRVDSAGSGEVVARGRLHTRLAQECKRCLTPIESAVDTEVTLVFAPANDLSEDDGEIRRIDPSEREIDLLPHVREEFILAVSAYAVCQPDCRGLCPGCGVNLNEEDCDCQQAETDPRWDALRALKEE